MAADTERDGRLDHIGHEPSDGLSYNPNESKYWDKAALSQELERSFDLCHSCRLCFKFCQSFPTLFEGVDARGDVRSLPDAVTTQVVDECFQCKLCYTQCPYTEAEGHEFKLDFPRLMLRANAIRRRAEGIPLREKMLGDPDRLGKMACRTAGLANAANRFRPHRLLMETAVGIHRDKLLPEFASTTFEAWAQRQDASPVAAADRPVVLFATCFVNYNRPEIGQAAHRVLTRSGCRVACPELNCCGMPALDGGDIAFAQQQARNNVETLLPLVEQGQTIAVLNPTCSLMMRQEYPELLDDPNDPRMAAAARTVAAATKDACEYLHDLRKAGGFNEDFKSTPGGPVAYHAPCHLRMQSIGFRGRDLMRRIPGVTPKLTAECCGHDGTWAMKTEYFQLSLKNGEKAFDGMQQADAEVWATECPLAAVQFEQACGKKALHPLEVIDRAYEVDGFPTRIDSEE
ncbi:MAG: heterodisulfide reductase-related iron-sulfur binding cluster [Vicinamibacterales bacterium]|nr:heterodisulfide reductase-related iron-sulfur binding cluster [Vicinamibacterales bacterium]